MRGWTVVFDLDGTLADTSGDMLAAANATFEAEGFVAPLVHPADTALSFQGGRAMLRAGAHRLGLDWDAARIDALYDPFLQAYCRNLDRHSYVYQGVTEGLDALAREGCRLAVCTNKPATPAERLLKSLGLADRFGAMIGADTMTVRKPDPAPLLEAVRRVGGDSRRTILVGDTTTDAETAARANAFALLVTFGAEGSSVADLRNHGVIDHMSELLPAVRKIMGTYPPQAADPLFLR